MVKIVVNVKELRSKADGDSVKDLAELLEKKTGVKPSVSGDELVLEDEEKALSKAYVRVLLRKFLHASDLREDFRVIAGENGALMFKERKQASE